MYQILLSLSIVDTAFSINVFLVSDVLFLYSINVLAVFYNKILCTAVFYRKRLVELFDKIERGQLVEGPKLSSLVTQLHKFRYFCFPSFSM